MTAFPGHAGRADESFEGSRDAATAGTLDLLIDVDGVLYPFPELFTEYAESTLGRQLDLDTRVWAFYEAWGIDHDGFVDLLARGVDERRIWWRGDPYAEVARTLHLLRAAGHRLHIVTARDIVGPDRALRSTRHWLDAYALRVDSINLAQHKPDVLDRLGLDAGRCVAVDDHERHVEAWLGVGVRAFVLDRWQHYAGSLPAVGDLAAFADELDDTVRHHRATRRNR